MPSCPLCRLTGDGDLRFAAPPTPPEPRPHLHLVSMSSSCSSQPVQESPHLPFAVTPTARSLASLSLDHHVRLFHPVFTPVTAELLATERLQLDVTGKSVMQEAPQQFSWEQAYLAACVASLSALLLNITNFAGVGWRRRRCGGTVTAHLRARDLRPGGGPPRAVLVGALHAAARLRRRGAARRLLRLPHAGDRTVD